VEGIGGDLRQTLGESGVQAFAEARSLAGAHAPRGAQHARCKAWRFLLLERGRIAMLPAVARAYEEMCDDKLGRVRARVSSAKPLDLASETEIRKALERRTGKKVLMTTVVDPTLIGGVVTHVAGLGDGIARVYGLDKAMAGELLDFPTASWAWPQPGRPTTSAS
jgi:hypothetical protein